jgi:hypothetical protein
MPAHVPLINTWHLKPLRMKQAMQQASNLQKFTWEATMKKY